MCHSLVAVSNAISSVQRE